MKNFIDSVKKYKTYILGALLVIFFFRSCSKSNTIRKSEKAIVEKEMVIDSLESVIVSQVQKIDSFPEVLREEKLDIHMEYDDFISKQDRGDQLMELHMIVKDNIKELQK